MGFADKFLNFCEFQTFEVVNHKDFNFDVGKGTLLATYDVIPWYKHKFIIFVSYKK